MFKFFFSLAVVAVVTTAMPAAADELMSPFAFPYCADYGGHPDPDFTFIVWNLDSRKTCVASADYSPSDESALECGGRWTKGEARVILSNPEMLSREMGTHRIDTLECMFMTADADEEFAQKIASIYMFDPHELNWSAAGNVILLALREVSDIDFVISLSPSFFAPGVRAHNSLREEVIERLTEAGVMAEFEGMLREWFSETDQSYPSYRLDVADILDDYGHVFSQDFLLWTIRSFETYRLSQIKTIQVIRHLKCGGLLGLEHSIQPPVYSDSMSYEEVKDAGVTERFLSDIEKRKRELCS